jgi:hypothetical protein
MKRLLRSCFKTNHLTDKHFAKHSKEAKPWHSRLFLIVFGPKSNLSYLPNGPSFSAVVLGFAIAPA